VIACGKLASALSISIAAARRKVDLVAAREEVRDNAGRLLIAQRLLVESEGVGHEARQLLDELLEAVKEEENYLGDD
jgi:alpha-galactosidase/6-phospho-beta-glucosidase family protein